MSGFYKMDPAAWDFGTADLSLEEEAAYLRIINAIHKHDGPVPNNDRVLAGLFRSSTRKARTLLDALVAAQKVTIEDGHIWNDRARSDMVRRGFVTISRVEAGAKGGRTRAANAANALINNNPPQAIASSRIEENRIEKNKREPNGSKSADLFDEVSAKTDTGFERFWSVYPLKKAKAAAEKNWARAIKKADAEVIIAAAERYAQSADVARGFAKYAQGWLTDERWNDDPANDLAPSQHYGGHRRSVPWGEVVR